MCPIDYKRYPPNWKTEIRPAVLARAKNRCEQCGFANGQTVYASICESGIEWFPTEQDARENGAFIKPVKVVLTIAHLDHDEENADVELTRLAALCQLHHLRYDRKEKRRRTMSKN